MVVSRMLIRPLATSVTWTMNSTAAPMPARPSRTAKNDGRVVAAAAVSTRRGARSWIGKTLVTR
jgi:hypothetical protein